MKKLVAVSNKTRTNHDNYRLLENDNAVKEIAFHESDTLTISGVRNKILFKETTTGKSNLALTYKKVPQGKAFLTLSKEDKKRVIIESMARAEFDPEAFSGE